LRYNEDIRLLISKPVEVLFYSERAKLACISSECPDIWTPQIDFELILAGQYKEYQDNFLN